MQREWPWLKGWRAHEREAGLDPEFLRPAEVDHLVGDASKSREKLGSEPRVSFRELVELMVNADVERLTASATRPELA